MQIYRENFEAAYIQSTEMFYRVKGPEQLAANGVQAYMKYADMKLREEEARTQRYLEPGSNGVIQCCVKVLVGNALPVLLAECAPLIKAGETERLQLMFRLVYRWLKVFVLYEFPTKKLKIKKIKIGAKTFESKMAVVTSNDIQKRHLQLKFE